METAAETAETAGVEAPRPWRFPVEFETFDYRRATSTRDGGETPPDPYEGFERVAYSEHHDGDNVLIRATYREIVDQDEWPDPVVEDIGPDLSPPTGASARRTHGPPTP